MSSWFRCSLPRLLLELSLSPRARSIDTSARRRQSPSPGLIPFHSFPRRSALSDAQQPEPLPYPVQLHLCLCLQPSSHPSPSRAAGSDRRPRTYRRQRTIHLSSVHSPSLLPYCFALLPEPRTRRWSLPPLHHHPRLDSHLASRTPPLPRSHQPQSRSLVAGHAIHRSSLLPLSPLRNPRTSLVR